jgi:hypothetical protein
MFRWPMSPDKDPLPDLHGSKSQFLFRVTRPSPWHLRIAVPVRSLVGIWLDGNLFHSAAEQPSH